MHRSPAISPAAVRATALAALAALGLNVAGCGGSRKPAAAPATTAGGTGGARLPWEASLTAGASFTLHNQIPEATYDLPVTVEVLSVEDDGGARVYRLEWGEGGNGPSTIRVAGTTVTLGDAGPEAMQEPWPGDDADTTCYAEDFSNPDGCEDVCDAGLCLSATRGVVAVTGLYAPNYGLYGAR
jgi:hypothetical protein